MDFSIDFSTKETKAKGQMKFNKEKKMI